MPRLPCDVRLSLRTVRNLVVAALAAVVIAPGAPGASATDHQIGPSCSTVLLPDNLISSNPYRVVVSCGPIAVVSDSGGTVWSVTLQIVVQLNNPTCGIPGVASAASTTDGNVGVLVDTMTFTAQPTDNVVLCYAMGWLSTGGGGFRCFDYDSVQSGCQGAMPTSVGFGQLRPRNL